MLDLKGQEFTATILPDLDPKRQGRYKVHIKDLIPHQDESKGIWVKNQIHSWRIASSQVGEYGQYFPLHVGTEVIVRFFNENVTSGAIIRIISDHVERSMIKAQDCTETVNSLEDRDEQYIIFKTPKKWSTFYINEDTEKEPNTIYLIYNRDNSPARRTVFRIDESGVTFWTRDNNRVRIKLDDNKQVDGNQTEYIKGYLIKHIDGDSDLKTSGNSTIEITGNCNISVTGNCNIYSASQVNVDSPKINLNCGIATSVPAKPKVYVRDLGPKETPEYDMGDAVGNKCDDVTTRYNNGFRQNLAE